MKKVKVKTKQKQKQKQTQIVNIHLDKILKKSQPKRKSQPKDKQFYSSQSSGGPSISFNAPPIREYVDTSLNNRQSALENPLLIKNTTNPISNEVGFSNNPLLNQPPQQKSIAYNLGQYLLQSSIPDSQMQQNMLYIKQGYENQEIANIEEVDKKNKIQSNFKKQQEAIRSQIPDDIKTPKKKRGPYKKTQKQESNPIQESPSTQELNQPEESITSTNALISNQPVIPSIISEPSQEYNITTGIETDKQRASRIKKQEFIKQHLAEQQALKESQKSKPIDYKKNEYIKNASSPRSTNTLIDEESQSESITSEQKTSPGISEGLGQIPISEIQSGPEDVKVKKKTRGPNKPKL